MTGSAPRFTVLLPIIRPPVLLPFAIDSVLAQSERAFELFIVSDGAPAATLERAKTFATADDRIRVFDFPKGERHGEAHRHVALGEARGRLVAQIADDDLWFPEYLSELGALLETVDFGNLPQPTWHPDGTLAIPIGDLTIAAVRDRMCRQVWNFFGPSFAGYRMDAYRRLPVGWSPAPAEIYTDLHMWRKFLQTAGLAFGTRASIQGVTLPASLRKGMPLEEREREQARVAAMFATERGRADFRAKAIASLLADMRRLHTGEVAELASARDELGRLQAKATEMALECEGVRQELYRERALHSASKTALADVRGKLTNAQAAYAAVLASTSWEITGPIRWVVGKLRRRRR